MSLESALSPSSPLEDVLQATQNICLDTARIPSVPLHVVLQPTQIIVPSEPTPDTTIFLSNIDRSVMYTVETVHFFAAGAYKPSENVAEVLREGLGRVLAGPYHFMAGRLVFSSQGRPEIVCNRRGAFFAEATCNCSIKDLGDLTTPKPEFKKFVLQAFNVKRLDDLPLVLVQVTRFRCGGFVVGLGTNHAAGDGIAAAQFILNYASVVRGKGLAMEPYSDRTCLKARSALRIEYEHNEFIRLSDLPPEAQLSFTTDSLGCDGSDVSGNMQPTETHIFRSFAFSKQDFDSLKKMAMTDGSVASCSGFDVLTAHLWKIRAQVTELKPEQPTSVFWAVDVRKRMKPPLHPNFCGNGIFTAHARATAGELSKMRLSSCVKRIQKATEAVTDEYVRSGVDWAEENEGIPAILEGCFFVAAWWKLPFNEVDYGWGKPFYWCPVVNGRVEFVLLLPSTSRDACRVYLALEPPQMAKFERLLYPTP